MALPANSITQADVEQFLRSGYVVKRQAFHPRLMAALLAAVRDVADAAAAQEEAGGEPWLQWVDREARWPSRLAHMLAPPLYRPAFSDWAEELLPALEALLLAPPRPCRDCVGART